MMLMIRLFIVRYLAYCSDITVQTDAQRSRAGVTGHPQMLFLQDNTNQFFQRLHVLRVLRVRRQENEALSVTATVVQRNQSCARVTPHYHEIKRRIVLNAFKEFAAVGKDGIFHIVPALQLLHHTGQRPAEGDAEFICIISHFENPPKSNSVDFAKGTLYP